MNCQLACCGWNEISRDVREGRNEIEFIYARRDANTQNKQDQDTVIKTYMTFCLVSDALYRWMFFVFLLCNVCEMPCLARLLLLIDKSGETSPDEFKTDRLPPNTCIQYETKVLHCGKKNFITYYNLHGTELLHRQTLLLNVVGVTSHDLALAASNINK